MQHLQSQHEKDAKQSVHTAVTSPLAQSLLAFSFRRVNGLEVLKQMTWKLGQVQSNSSKVYKRNKNKQKMSEKFIKFVKCLRRFASFVKKQQCSVCIWHVAPLRFAPAFRALGVCEHSWLRFKQFRRNLPRVFNSMKLCNMTLSQVTNTRDIWLLKIRPSDQPKCITPNDLKPNDLKPSEKIPTELVKAHDLQKDRKYFQLVCFMVPLEDVTVALVSGYQSNTLLVFIKQNSAVFHEPIPRLYFKAFCRRYEGAILFSKLWKDIAGLALLFGIFQWYDSECRKDFLSVTFEQWVSISFCG